MLLIDTAMIATLSVAAELARAYIRLQADEAPALPPDDREPAQPPIDAGVRVIPGMYIRDDN